MRLRPEDEDIKDVQITRVKFEKRRESGVSMLQKSSYKVCKEEFLEDNDYVEVRKSLFDSESAAELEGYDPAIHDAWVVQCPKGMDLSSLTNKRIKMPGRRYVDNLQVRTTNYTQPLSQSIGYVNAKGKYTLRRMPLAGNIIVSKRLNQEKPSADEETDSSFPKQSKPQKLRFPLRHPFFGRNYKELIEVDKKITKKLHQAEKKSAEATINSRSTLNYYSIRSKMLLGGEQTLKQKEHEVRQSVLTGVTPKFMIKSAHSNIVDLTNLEDDDEDTKPVKPKKRKSKNGVNESLTNGDVVEEEAAPESAKQKKKKRKTEEETSTKSFKKMKA